MANYANKIFTLYTLMTLTNLLCSLFRELSLIPAFSFLSCSTVVLTSITTLSCSFTIASVALDCSLTTVSSWDWAAVMMVGEDIQQMHSEFNLWAPFANSAKMISFQMNG